jgi:hypothetical protein
MPRPRFLSQAYVSRLYLLTAGSLPLFAVDPDLLEKTDSYLSKPLLASAIGTSGEDSLCILSESKIDEPAVLLSSQIPKPLWVDRNAVGASHGDYYVQREWREDADGT